MLIRKLAKHDTGHSCHQTANSHPYIGQWLTKVRRELAHDRRSSGENLHAVLPDFPVKNNGARPYRNSASNDFWTLYATGGIPRVNHQL
jgi:hypothetical protein